VKTSRNSFKITSFQRLMSLIRYKKEYYISPLTEKKFWDFSDGTSVQFSPGIDYLGYEEIPARLAIMLYTREGNSGLGYTILASELLSELERKINKLNGVKEIKNNLILP